MSGSLITISPSSSVSEVRLILQISGRFGSSLSTLPMYLSHFSSPNNLFWSWQKWIFHMPLSMVLGTPLQNGYVSQSTTPNSVARELTPLWTQVLAPFLGSHQWMGSPFNNKNADYYDNHNQEAWKCNCFGDVWKVTCCSQFFWPTSIAQCQ